MRVAIAGATGNCGREVLRAARARGLVVRALVRDAAKLEPVRDCVDEVREVQVTERESLRGALDGVDIVISALGKTFQKDQTPRRVVDVDANAHLFDEARAAGVRRAALVSVFGAAEDHPIALMRMKGEAEAALRATGVPSVVIRPTGFFSDLWELFEMARRGTFWLIGDGQTRMNPVALEDLGAYIVDSVLDDARLGQVLPCGGPDVLSTREIGEAAGRVLGRPVKMRSLPLWLARAGVAAIKPFSRNTWEMGQFFVGQVVYLKARGEEAVAPAVGTRRLEDYYRERYRA